MEVVGATSSEDLAVACCVTDGDDGGRHRSSLTPQFGRHSAPSRIGGRTHLPPSDVVTPPGGRPSNTGDEVAPSAVSPLTVRRPAAARRPDPRRTYKVKPVAVAGPADRARQELPSSHGGYPADVDQLRHRDELPEHVVDNRRR